MGLKIPFYKMSACGNDFCIIDHRNVEFPGPLSPLVKAICKRRVALGADGLILLESSDTADFTMRFFNSDGGEVEMCGNGARCVARFAYVNGIAPQKMSFMTRAGLIQAEVTKEGVKIGMGDVRFSHTQARVNLLDVFQGTEAYFITVGVPHVIGFANDIDGIEVDTLGAKIRHHKQFRPDGTNASFVEVTGPHSMQIRTYERGVEAETLACGTGSTAAAIIAVDLGMVTPPVEVRTRSGCPLRVGFSFQQGIYQDIWLAGEARIICNGMLWIDEIDEVREDV